MVIKLKKTKKKSNLIKLSIGITFISLLYKLLLVYFTMSLVLLIATIPTLIVLVCKVLYIKNVKRTRDKKKKAYYFMLICIFLYSLIFILFVVLKFNGIDISNDKTYNGWIGSLFIMLLIIIFILSILSLKDAVSKDDIMVIGLKEIAFVSALSDSVIIEEYISRIILEYKTFKVLETINNYYSLAIGIIMLCTSVIMFFRIIKYKA